MTVDRDDLRDELLAVVRARQELPQQDEAYLVEQFLDRLNREIDARIENRIAAHTPRHRPSSAWLVLAVLGISIPVSAVGAVYAGVWGLMVAWIAIIAVVAVVTQAPRD